MIRITKINERLSIFKECKVFLWGAGMRSKEMLKLLTFHGVTVKGICDNNQQLWGRVFDEEDIPIISPKELQEISRSEKVTLQISFEGDDKTVVEQIRVMGIHSYVAYEEAKLVLMYIKQCKIREETNGVILKSSISYVDSVYENVRQQWINRLLELEDGIDVILCQAVKTGDTTMTTTLQKKGINCVNVWHTPELINKTELLKKYKKIKISMAIREPISQNLSYLYMALSRIGDATHSIPDRLGIEDIAQLFCYEGGDVQKIFDLWIEASSYIQGYNDYFSLNNSRYAMIQHFIVSFQLFIVDFMQYPFDKEAGYTLIKNGNIEVFVYQLEKIDNILPQMSDWLETPIDNLINGNIRENTWLGESYKQAKRDIRITQEYFDKCFSEPYIKHCYSEHDIEKFKAKWKKHIR